MNGDKILAGPAGDCRNTPWGQDRRRIGRKYAKHEARLLAGLSLLDADAGVDSGQHTLTLACHTVNISADGLGLVVPSIALDERSLTAKGHPLRIVIDLPPAPVEIQATPVRLQRLDDQDPARGYLIGAQIVKMSDSERTRFIDYLRTSR